MRQLLNTLAAYCAAQPQQPGPPADYASVYQGGDVYRLMVMTDVNDLVLERVGGGEALLLGRVHDRDVVGALLGPVWAERELTERSTRLELDEAVALLESRPESAAAEQELIRSWQTRCEQADRLLEDGRRRSFAVIETETLGQVANEDLHRRGQIDYDAVDWRRVCASAESYLKQGGDPLDIHSAYEHGRGAGLDENEAEWLEGLFQDPICPSGEQYGNGRHRAMALKAQSVEQVVVDTRSAMPQARRRALLVQSGAPVAELSGLSESPRSEAMKRTSLGPGVNLDDR